MSRNVLLSLYESNDRDDFCFQVLTSLWPGLAPPGELHTSWKCQEISRDFSFGMSLVILNLSDTPTTLSSLSVVISSVNPPPVQVIRLGLRCNLLSQCNFVLLSL